MTSDVLSGDRTFRGLLEQVTAQLRNGGIDDARRNAEWMICRACGVTRSEIIAHGGREASADQAEVLSEFMRRRIEGEPVQHILGETDFFGLTLKVTADALIPRPETESVVERALAVIEDIREPLILDVGTGSGCIALALKDKRPDATVHAVDSSAAALALARENAARCELDITVEMVDISRPDAFRSLPHNLDLLISNPPYIPESEAAGLPAEVRDHEPAAALFSGKDPLHYYRILAPLGKRLLQAGGWFVAETHADFAGEVATVLSDAGYGALRVENDLADRPRVVIGRLPRTL